VIDLEHGTHIESVHCTGDWVLDCQYSEAVYLCKGLRFSQRCILTVGDFGKTNLGSKSLTVFGKTVSATRWENCLDALVKIFRTRDPFTYNAKTCLWEPNLRGVTVAEIKSFDEFDQTMFDYLFRPFPIMPSDRATKLGLLLDR